MLGKEKGQDLLKQVVRSSNMSFAGLLTPTV